MPEYRIYPLDCRGQIVQQPWITDADGDMDAASMAFGHCSEARGAEVWKGTRRVCRLAPLEAPGGGGGHHNFQR